VQGGAPSGDAQREGIGCRWVHDGVCARAEPPALRVVPSYTLATAHQGYLLAILFAVISGHVAWWIGYTVPHGVSAPHVSPVLHTSVPAHLTRVLTCVPTTLAVS
jgi:hypothetical protein